MLQTKHNILHIIDTLWLGGAQRVVKTLFEENQDNNNIHLLVLRHTDQMIEVDHPNVSIVPVKWKWDFIKAFQTAKKYIKSHQIKTIHCHLPKSQTFGVFLKSDKNLKLVFHEQGDITNPFPFNFPAYTFGRNKIDKVICCSNYVKENVLRKTGIKADKTEVIYNFSTSKNIRGKSPELTGSLGTGLKLGFAGRITHDKGWGDLTEAFHQIINSIPSVVSHLHIAGTGPEMEKLKSKINKLGLIDHVTLWGFVKEMHEFYSEIDVLCVPSRNEPLGMVHLEAMEHGVAVIASDVKGMSELLVHGENCLLYPPKSPEQIVKTINLIANDITLRNKLIENGQQTIQSYNFAYFEKKLNRVYNELKA